MSIPLELFPGYDRFDLPFIALAEGVVLPEYGSAGAVGLDLKAYIEDSAIKLSPGERAVIPTALAVAIPNGWYGRLAPRSGRAARWGLDVLAGVIDQDYRGEIKVVLINLGDEQVWIRHGDRIAQLIVERCARAQPVFASDLTPTARAEAGFGSTGV